MKITIPALALAAVVVILHLALGDHGSAEEHVQSFYAKMLSADFAGAQKEIDEAIRLWPENARYYEWKAYLGSQTLPPQCGHCAGPGSLDAVSLNTANQAIADYQKSAAINPRDAVLHHNLGWLNHLTGNDRAAKQEWERAVALDPNNAVFHASFGMFLEELGEMNAMRQQYTRSIELSPEIVDSPFFESFRDRFASTAVEIVHEIIDRLEQDLRRTGDTIVKARLGKLYLFSQNVQRASELLQEAAADLPNLPLVWFNLGETRRLLGQPGGGFEEYVKARALKGDLPGPLVRLGQIFQRQGQTAMATEYFKSAVRAWERMTPITAAHNQRLYHGSPQRIDELLPTNLVWYTAPCEASTAYRSLAELVPKNSRYSQRANICEGVPSPHCARSSETSASR
jgi:tetratricopeptide (TPR) repeat protein